MSATKCVDFGLLGPVQATARGKTIRLYGPRQERLLALLLLNADQSVSMDRLIDVVWERQPPSTAKRQIQDLVSHLRRTLSTIGAPSDTIELARGGYLLRLEGHRLDACSFEELTADARAQAATDPVVAVKTLRAALALWRGPALAGLGSVALAAAAQAWNERRLTAWEECLRLELSLGRHREVVGELMQLVADHPFHQGPAGLLMRALAASGRRFDALKVYRDICARLLGELGMEPGADLRRIQHAILSDN